MKKQPLFQPGSAWRSSRRWLQLCPDATAGELSRVVAWGDINYDFTNTPAKGGAPVAGIAAGDFTVLVLQTEWQRAGLGRRSFRPKRTPCHFKSTSGVEDRRG